MDYKNYILCGLIAFGMIVTVISKPAPDERSTVDDETLQNDGNDDYEYIDTSSSPDQVKSTASSPKSTILPYFDNQNITRTVKPGGDITLDCPVKNLAETNVILWFKEENIIINNLNVLDHAYNVSQQNYSLVIKNATEYFAGKYVCEIAPQKIRMQTILKVTNETVSVATIPPELPQVKEAAKAIESTPSTATNNLAVSSLIFVVLGSTLMSNLLSHRKCFQLLFTY